MNRVGYVFLLCVGIAVVVSLLTGPKTHPKAIRVADISFRTTPGFNIASGVVTAILIGLYWYWW